MRKYVRYNVDFVDIQNQYFISSTNAGRPKNKIALAIARRLHHLLALYSHLPFSSRYSLLFYFFSAILLLHFFSLSLFSSFLFINLASYVPFDRIKRAIENNEKFRIIVLLPIHSEGFLAEKRTRFVTDIPLFPLFFILIRIFLVCL